MLNVLTDRYEDEIKQLKHKNFLNNDTFNGVREFMKTSLVRYIKSFLSSGSNQGLKRFKAPGKLFFGYPHLPRNIGYRYSASRSLGERRF